MKHGPATETLLTELAVEEERAKAVARQLAELEQQQANLVPLDRARLMARLQVLGRNMRSVLAARGPEVRGILQRALNGRRVACEPFREPGRRGYRFRATGTRAGALSTDVGGPKWICHLVGQYLRFSLEGIALRT